MLDFPFLNLSLQIIAHILERKNAVRDRMQIKVTHKKVNE